MLHRNVPDCYIRYRQTSLRSPRVFRAWAGRLNVAIGNWPMEKQRSEYGFHSTLLARSDETAAAGWRQDLSLAEDNPPPG